MRYGLLVFAIGAAFAQGNISTYAGGGGQFTGDGKPSIAAQIAQPSDVAVDANGNVFFACPPLNMVMEMTTDGVLHVVAGNGLHAFSGDGGPAQAAALASPMGVKVDAAGNLIIVDTENNRIRKVTPAGIITTIAGTGFSGASGDGGPAAGATLSRPVAVALDPAGNIYVADFNNNRVRMVTAAGVISTAAGTGTGVSSGDNGPAAAAGLNAPLGVAADAGGNVYVSEDFGKVRKFRVGGAISTFAGGGNSSSDGIPAIQARLSVPAGLAFDKTGQLYITDSYNSLVRRVDLNGNIQTVAGNGQAAFSGDGAGAISASLSRPNGVATGADGAVYIADLENDRIRKVAAGTISTIAGAGAFFGDGGASTAARLFEPVSLGFDPSGNLYILTNDRRVRMVTPNGTISTAAGNGRSDPGTTFGRGDGGPAINASFQNQPTGIAFDSQGALYIATNLNIRKVVNGVISTFYSNVFSFATNLGPLKIAVDSTGNLYMTNAPEVVQITPNGSVTTVAGSLRAGFSGDGGPATTAAFGLNLDDIAIGPDGSLFLADFSNNRVRKVSPSGIVNTIAGNGSNVFSGDGGPATAAGLPAPTALAFDSKGNLFIATNDNRVRKVAPDGNISTYAGNGWFGSSGDGGSALGAELSGATALSVDASGNLYISEYSNNVVRFVQNGPAPFLLLSQEGLTFKTTASSSSGAQNLTIVNSGQGTVSWTVSTSVASGATNWLSATPATGTSLAGQAGPVVSVKTNPAGLAPGDYYGQVVVSSPGVPNSPQTVTVVLSEQAANTSAGSLVQPGGLLFTGTAPQSLTLTSTAGGGSKFNSSPTFTSGQQWFTYQPASGTVPAGGSATVTVQPSASGLAAGVYNGAITFVFDDGTVVQVGLLLVVAAGGSSSSPLLGATAAGPGAVCAATKLLPLITSLGPGFSATAGWPASLEVQVVDDCTAPLTKGSVVAAFSNNDPPLALNSLLDGRWTGTYNGGNSGQVTISVKAQDASGVLAGTAQIAGNLNVNNNPPPAIASGGVLDAASYRLGGAVAPGSLVSIFGSYLAQPEAKAAALPLPNTLSTTQVTVAGRTMPLLYAGPSQVNAMVPFDLAINATQQVVVRRGTTISIPEPISVLSSGSGVFTKDLTGSGTAIVVKVAADGTQSLVGPDNPAHASDALVIYCDGLGNVSPQAVAGAAAPVTPLSQTLDTVTVTMGGVNATVFFAGLTPGFTGLYQVNAFVPGGVSPGDNVQLVIAQSGRSSPPVTISVR